MNVGNYLNLIGHTDVLTISRTLSLAEAHNMMQQHHARSLVITGDEDHLPVGFLTMNDVASALIGLDEARNLRVAKAMSVLSPEKLVSPDTPLVECANLILTGGITHLCIGKKGEPMQGVFSPTDWLRILLAG